MVAELFFITAEKGANTSVYLATNKSIEGVTGKYFELEKEREESPQAIGRSKKVMMKKVREKG